MSRGPVTFKQSDLTRAIKAFLAAGLEVARAEIFKDGRIIIVPGEPTTIAVAGAPDRNEWDDET